MAANQVPLVIPNGEQLTDEFATQKAVVGYGMPSAVTGTITLEGYDGVTGSWRTLETLSGALTEFKQLTNLSLARGCSRFRIASSLAEAAERQFVLLVNA